jgi:hypothetical protein
MNLCFVLRYFSNYVGHKASSGKITVSDKLERIRIKSIVTYFKALSQNFPGDTV